MKWLKGLAIALRDFMVTGLVKEERMKQVEDALNAKIDKKSEESARLMNEHRIEAQAGHNRLRSTVTELSVDMTQRLIAMSAEQREADRDNRAWMERQFAVQFEKIDGFVIQVLANQRDKK